MPSAASNNLIHVGIVGAGFAGLRCADILLQKGCKVTILEARERLGGRVAQSNHLGHLVDLGPNWIHGDRKNAIFELAKVTGTVLHAWEEIQVVRDPQGCAIDPDEVAEYAELLWDDGVIAEAFKYSKENTRVIEKERSLYDFFVEKSRDFFQAETEGVAERKRESFLLFTRMWGAYVGSPVERQSLKFFWLEECIEGENPFVAETYGKILNGVARSARCGADIKLGQNVTKIMSSNDEDGCRKPSICSSDGTRLSFDEIVVTTPLGWLKRNKAAFEPALPPRLAQAIDNIGYGTLDKVYITFPTAFWEEKLAGEAEVATRIDPEGTTPNVRATTLPIHQPSSSQQQQESTSNYPSGALWLCPAYAPDTNPHGWHQECLFLSALPTECSHPTLLFYIYGDCSRHIAQLASSSPHEHPDDVAVNDKIVDFFHPYFSRLPNYDPHNPACTPIALLATAWANDEFAGYGSYSNFQVGLDHADEDIEVLRCGMLERGIWFAGEHTAPFVALGTTTGAYVSGEEVAGKILEARGV